MIESWEIAGGLLEYIDETHTYLYNGVILPSITQILKIKFGNKYNGVSKEVLQKASVKGTKVHQAIEDYEKRSIDDLKCKELRNYKFLKSRFGFECLENEIPIVLFLDGKPVCAGRIDLILKEKEAIGVADIKRTSIKAAWEREAFEEFRSNLKTSCPECGKRKLCLGGCPIVPEMVLCEENGI